MWKTNFIVLACLLCFIQTTLQRRSRGSKTGERKKRLFNVFQIVRFPNDACSGGTSNGTCYTSEECSNRNGRNEGTCANGYGVCCVFVLTCGSSSSENCTVFESNGNVQPGACTAKICPASDNICQLRIDFNTFTISGPSTISDSEIKINGGSFNPGGVSATRASQCLTDVFRIIDVAGGSSDQICGVNTGQHLYVDTVEDRCASLMFQLGGSGVGTTVSPRSWAIKVTQYACDFRNLAPSGCDQFYFGSSSGIVSTFNFNGGNGQHLANQDQTICVRQEQANCRICWTTINDADFKLSGPTANMVGYNKGTICCDYGVNGLGVQGYDCVHIPIAKDVSNMLVPSQLCGRSKGLVTANLGAVAKTVCSNRVPFQIQFRSDAFEFINEVKNLDSGFQLVYSMDSKNC